MADLADDLVIEAPVSFRPKVYDFPRKQILSNHIGAGERLVEGRAARQISISRTHIRGALHKRAVELARPWEISRDL